MRQASLSRKTAETSISLSLALDGQGDQVVDTGIGFFDHMLTLWARHGLFDLTIKAAGDLAVDGHHTVEDCGIVLGQAFKEALGDKTGIARFGDSFVPMDEALAQVVIDLSGRSYLVFAAELPRVAVGAFDAELLDEFLQAFVRAAGVNMHVRLLAGKNVHHMIEAIMKAFGRALSAACRRDERIKGVLSTKGMLE